MASTRTTIISKVSILLGNGKVQTHLKPTPFVIGANEMLDLSFAEAYDSYDWRFGTTAIKLGPVSVTVTEQATNPLLKRFKNKFLLPGDYISLTEMFDRFYYEIFEDSTLYADPSSISFSYKRRPIISELPSYFVTFLVYKIAENMSIAAAQQDAYLSIFQKKAEIALSTALYTDAQSHPNRGMTSAPFLEVRSTNGMGGLRVVS